MAQSSIADDLGVYGTAPMWFTTSYVISMSCFGPIIGRLAGTIFSPRVLIAVASIIFALGGLLTAASTSFAILVVGRVVCGMGGAGILTLAIILVIQLASDKRRGILVGLVNVGFTIGLSLGAVVFGAAVPSMGWRVLFGAQAPISLLAGTGVLFSLPTDFQADVGPEDTRSMWEKLGKVDYLGAFLMVSQPLPVYSLVWYNQKDDASFLSAYKYISRLSQLSYSCLVFQEKSNLPCSCHHYSHSLSSL